MVGAGAAPGRLFVGRERELEELSTGLADAQAGRGRLFLLVGEPGIGKTRLADELGRRAVAGGARVPWGRCWEGGGAPAYWPWTQVLRAYVRETPVDVALAQMGAGATDLAQISPELRAQVGAAVAAQPEQARFGLFDSLTSFLHTAAAERPLVLVLDDLHAADEASLRLLQFVARDLHGAALLVVGTYRDADLRRAPSLLPIVADLVREGPRLALRGLTSAEVGHFLSGAATPPQDHLVTAIHQATGGNPFFVTEVVRLWLADGAARRENPDAGEFQVPDEVREAIRRRLVPLSPNAATLLSVAAVIGREFDADLVARVLALGDAFGETLVEATASGLIEEGPPGRYLFAHALVRQTLHGDQSPSRRVTLHAAVAAALEVECGDDPEPHLADLAHHFYHAAAAGVADEAVAYATRAAEQAMRHLAYEDAAAQYERALHARELRHAGPVDAVGDALARAELLLALGHAQRHSGTQALWRPTYRRAATAARAAIGTPRAPRARACSPARPWALAAPARPGTSTRRCSDSPARRSLRSARRSRCCAPACSRVRQWRSTSRPSPGAATRSPGRLSRSPGRPATSPPRCAVSWRGTSRCGAPITSTSGREWRRRSSGSATRCMNPRSSSRAGSGGSWRSWSAPTAR